MVERERKVEGGVLGKRERETERDRKIETDRGRDNIVKNQE